MTILDEGKVLMPRKSQTPALRFAGFTGEWEERKLGEIMEVASVKRIHQSDWRSDGIRFLRARDIVAAFKNEELSDYLYISKEKYDEFSSVSGKVGIGDLLVTGVGTIGVPYLIESSDPIYFKDGNIIWFKNGKRIKDSFFYFSFVGRRIQNFIADSAGIGTVGTYTIESGKKTPIVLPCHKEQAAIGDLFRSLDTLITAQQKKVEKLKCLKKGLMEKMFPRGGRTLPEVRFAGFSGEWVERLVAETASFSKGAGYTKADICNQGTPLILYGRLYTKYETVIREVDTFAVPKVGSVYSRGGEVIIPASGETAEDIAIASVVCKSGVLLGGDLNVIMPNDSVESSFLALSFVYSDAHSDLTRLAQGKSVVHIHNSDIQTVTISFPDKKEQKRISEMVESFDKLITLHGKKLEKLRHLKQACLGKMFV